LRNGSVGCSQGVRFRHPSVRVVRRLDTRPRCFKLNGPSRLNSISSSEVEHARPCSGTTGVFRRTQVRIGLPRTSRRLIPAANGRLGASISGVDRRYFRFICHRSRRKEIPSERGIYSRRAGFSPRVAVKVEDFAKIGGAFCPYGRAHGLGVANNKINGLAPWSRSE